MFNCLRRRSEVLPEHARILLGRSLLWSSAKNKTRHPKFQTQESATSDTPNSVQNTEKRRSQLGFFLIYGNDLLGRNGNQPAHQRLDSGSHATFRSSTRASAEVGNEKHITAWETLLICCRICRTRKTQNKGAFVSTSCRGIHKQRKRAKGISRARISKTTAVRYAAAAWMFDLIKY
jgi:hypothetical protein